MPASSALHPSIGNEDGEGCIFKGETCQKSGGFHHLGKNSSEEGKVARKRQFADHRARFV